MKDRQREERKRENSEGGRDGEGKEEGKKLNESHSYVFHSPASEFTTCRASEGEGERGAWWQGGAACSCPH